ncbi:hypothetical protein AGMMS50239_32420 [Bacteroidia bacterium]|nr:hypothetical protein AGMMS50239_32420 [Bacteroidia bacterium]
MDAVTDPVSPNAGSDRVLRGGNWNYGTQRCRSACRGYNIPGYASYFTGFRVVWVQ